MAASDAKANGRHHKRTPSSVLKSLMGPRSHKQHTSIDVASPSYVLDENRDARTHMVASKRLPLLPGDHPHASQLPLSELAQNQIGNGSRPAQLEGWRSERQVVTAPGMDERGNKLKSKNGHQLGPVNENQHKKAKSQTGFGALLSRPRSSKGLNKETVYEGNESEQPSDAPSAKVPPPIYAQFASQPFHEISHTTNVVLNDARVHQEILQYTPVNYSPSKQKNYSGGEQPTLGKRNSVQKPRPTSEYLTSSTSGSVIKAALFGIRSSSNESSRPSSSSRESVEQKRRPNSFWGGRPVLRQASTSRSSSDDASKSRIEDQGAPKRTSRVKTAVATFGMKGKEAQKQTVLDTKAIETSFEALLDSRNVPQNMRQRLRSLDTRIKADFIKQDNAANVLTPTTTSAAPMSSMGHSQPEGPTPGAPHVLGGSRPTTPGVLKDDATSASPSKRPRPRSKTFTFNKGDKDSSPTKKCKSDGSNAAGPAKSSEFSSAGPSKSLTSSGAADAMALGYGNRSKPPVPQDFVIYLKEVYDVQAVEVSKLHKLRLVLRNERVAWVDTFISMGGMAQIVGLLYRIMAVEWREEHEDLLLHEALLCLKALCTTALALRELHHFQTTLFPALIKMLFDEEKKGPSEFTTRGIIISLLVTYLGDAPSDQVATRAQVILSYLRDPGPSEDEQPPGFIRSMHQSRPYRVWCKEVVSVTKEVFWIFLHNVNVVPIAPTDPSSSLPYSQTHFPKERPPVPAAPYVGGVEWDATNYIGNHVDLMNGLIACLPSRSERNSLRHELRVSGFERMMGGSLRKCKEKFYGSVHDGLRTWVAAAVADEWEVRDVRLGPELLDQSRSCSPRKKREEKAPKVELELPGLDHHLLAKKESGAMVEGGEWLY